MTIYTPELEDGLSVALLIRCCTCCTTIGLTDFFSFLLDFGFLFLFLRLSFPNDHFTCHVSKTFLYPRLWKFSTVALTKLP